MAARPPSSEEAALSLTMAVVASSPGPLLLLDGDLVIIAASQSFAAAFALGPEPLDGRKLENLGRGEWDVPQLRALLAATASGAARIGSYEMDLERPGAATRHLVIHAQRLIYLDVENLRLVMAVSDVTDARANERVKDEALRQNLILLQEVRHRVANSLQIIASLLMQNAKTTQSEETRGHLNDAHNRVMSIAALERQLAGSGEGEVELHAYFTKLCDSIAASMIGDPTKLRLLVTGDSALVDSRASVSLGLIVIELVINALKHGFPAGRAGSITVDYRFAGASWSLSVRDDGVGLPTGAGAARSGLGTSIVAALARQLAAKVLMERANPGTKVTIDHRPANRVGEDATPLDAGLDGGSAHNR
jgi:two-component sensor histidine kinase